MTHAEAEVLARRYGDAFYLYDEGRFVANFQALLSAFRRHYQNTQIAYSYKTNYTPAVCQRVDALGGYAEVVSAMEYALARRIGVRPDKIVYNGPWKSDDSIEEALAAGSVVNLDSERDLRSLLQIAAKAPSVSMRVGLRCNFPLDDCQDSRFGFDAEGDSFWQAIAKIRELPNVTLAGLHCHFPQRKLRSFAGRANAIAELAQRVFRTPPEFISIGGGFFGHMPKVLRSRFADGVPEFDDYAGAVGQVFAKTYGGAADRPLLFIEPGTALVADTFSFVARVLDLKTVRSRRLACVAGSIFNISPYARVQDLPVTILGSAHAEPNGTSTDIVGYTCIEGDVMAKAVPGPLSVGDFVMFANVGSYSIVMKPPFILPNVPIVMQAEGLGTEKLLKRAESFEYIFENFIF